MTHRPRVALALCALAALPSTPRIARAQEHASSPPVPVELTAGSEYASVDLVLSKPFTATTRWGVFHQHTLVASYGGDVADDLATQTQLTFAARRWLYLTAGGFYATGPGVSPTTGLQLVGAGRSWFASISPRINIERRESYSVFTFLQYARGRRYANLQALNAFDAHHHIKSYQWLRAGIDVRGTQLGGAVNFDELGPDPDVKTSAGIFVRRSVF